MSQTPHKSLQKMCKSPKNSYPIIKQEKIDYESLSTNCTVVGSNNLNLVKKPQMVAGTAYPNSSPVYPQSPYSSPVGIKSPSPSLKPPTPQPSFPVMQIIHNNLLARPTQSQNIIKLKPPLNILPKPSASPQPSPKPSVSPQIVIPTNHQQAAATATIMPAAQPLLLNQMPMLTAPGVQFILRPQTTAKIQPQVQTAAGPGLILQPTSGQQLLQIQPPRTQPMVRVLTNGMHLTPTSTTTYVTQVGGQQPVNATQIAQQTIVNNTQQIIQHQVKKKPKHKVKKKLDLANIMKLSGIGDEDDIQFESDTSQSESEPNSIPTTPQPQQIGGGAGYVHPDPKKNIQNIQISAIPQQTINSAPVVQVLNQNFQSGMISNSSSQAAAAQASIPFNSFITPNFTINNGLMLQRSGGFKLTMGEDGRLVLQHDPTLNQDLQSQLILQSLLGLNGGLVLQPSMDQQTVQQTVQTIQQQSVQTIQQQTVQSQTIQTVQQQTVQPQTVQHTIQSLQPQIQQQTVQQTIQHQTVNALQQPMQIVQPQPIPSIHSQVQPIHSIAQSQVHHLQSQIQSLLQQQAQNISPQTLQNVQSIQNLQTLQPNVQSLQQNIPQNVPQTVHPQTIQSPVHSVQNFSTQTPPQTQPVLKVQPFQKSQPPVQTVQPIPHHHPQQQQQNLNENQQNNNPPPTSYVVNLTPEQLEQLKRNGQLTVNGQTIFMQRPSKDQNEKKMSPKSKPPIKKVNKVQSIKSILQENVNDSVKTSNNTEQIKESIAKPLVSALNAPKHVLPQNHVQPQPIQSKPVQQQAMVQPHAMVQPSVQVQNKVAPERTKPVQLSPQIAKPQKVSPHLASPQTQDSNGSNTNPDVDKLLGQILEESGGVANSTSNNMSTATGQPQQRITTIQLTPQKQQHLKSIQVQIQTLSARLTPGDTEMNTALKLLFAEQQKILASGKLLPPDKVYYHQLTNQLTIVNPSSLNLSPPVQVKNEPPSPSSNPVPQQQQQQQTSQKSIESQTSSQQPVPTTPHGVVSRLSAQPTSETTATQTIHHHPHPLHAHPHQRNQSPHHNHLQQPQQTQVQHHAVQGPQHPNHHVVHQRVSGHHVVQQQPQQQQQPSQPFLQQQPQLQAQQVQQPAQQQQPSFLSLAKKSHLIETQLNLDQNGAIKPDVHTPFRDKKDACIRLIRYHCLDQPVLSEKDLDKADEIFELTARHFIGKYVKMVDKYRYLLMKESMRQVQTSELMMLDRMFLAEEQHALLKLRQEGHNAAESSSPAAPSGAPSSSSNGQSSGSATATEPPSEDYDEWACIQRELGCLPEKQQQQQQADGGQAGAVAHVQNNSKRSACSDSRLETLKRFRVDKHHKKPSDVHVNSGSVQSATAAGGGGQSTIYVQSSKSSSSYDESLQASSYSSHGEENEPENNSIDEQVQSAIDSILNLQQNTPLDLDSILS